MFKFVGGGVIEVIRH